MTETQRGKWTSASSAQADSLCPGRYQAQLGLPEEITDASESGTKIHAALAKQSDEGLSANEASVYEACCRLEQELVVKWFGPEVAGLKATPLREKRFWIKFQDKEHSGQVDVLYRRGDKALILDDKTLTGEVPNSPRNMQLRDLAVLVWHNTPLLTGIAVAVIQPLVTMKPELCVYGAEDIKQASSELTARVTASHDPNAKRVPGEAQCKFCRARLKCQEHAKWASSMLPSVSILDVPVAEWTALQCATFCNNKAVARKWLDECEEAMKKRLTADPMAVPGWTLEPGKIMTPIINPQGVFDRFSARGGSLDQFMGCVNVKKGELKEQLKAVTKEKGKALDQSMKALCEGFTGSDQHAPSLARKEEK